MNLQAGFEDTLPGSPLARLVLADWRRVTVVWALPLPMGIFAAGQVSKRLSSDFPEPAGERSAA